MTVDPELKRLEQAEDQDPDNQELSANRRSRPRRVKRTKRERESHEMAQMVFRVARSMVRRASTGDLEALRALRQMRQHIDDATKAAAQELHSPTDWVGGYSWTEIARELGISRQAARQQFSLKDVPDND